jgi:prephenate dehydratase
MSEKIAIQGDIGSFHDIAANLYFGTKNKLIYCDTFSAVFESIKSNKATFGLCAIENSLYGSINETYDLILKHKFYISGEIYLQISQNLIGIKGTNIDQIEEIYSHSVAISQCSEFLDQNLSNAKRIEYYDTAASVELIKKKNNKALAAIASSYAAELYDMEIIQKNIESNKNNFTRFVVVSKELSELSGSNKTSLVLEALNEPGSLFNVLGVFAKKRINITKIESRPIIGKIWHYYFYIDIDVGSENGQLSVILNELSEMNCKTIVLGSYKSGILIKN